MKSSRYKLFVSNTHVTLLDKEKGRHEKSPIRGPKDPRIVMFLSLCSVNGIRVDVDYDV